MLTGSVYHSFLEGRRKFDQEKWKVPIKMFYCERDPIKKDLVVVLPFILILIWQSRCRVRYCWTFTIVVRRDANLLLVCQFFFPRKNNPRERHCWKVHEKQNIEVEKHSENYGIWSLAAVTLRRITFEKSLLRRRRSSSQDDSSFTFLPALLSLLQSLFTRQHTLSRLYFCFKEKATVTTDIQKPETPFLFL